MKQLARGLTLLLLLAVQANAQLQSLLDATPGQQPTHDKPVILAPGRISQAFKTRDFAITPEGDICFFAAMGIGGQRAHLAYMLYENGIWQEPALCDFSGLRDVQDIEPCLSPDGKTLYFVSNRIDSQGSENGEDKNIWSVTVNKNRFGIPQKLPPEVNSADMEFFPSVARNGDIYFSRKPNGMRAHFIYRAVKTADGYELAVRLPETINAGPTQFHAYIDPDQDFIIVPVAGIPGGSGGIDYHISYRNSKGEWSIYQNLGPHINTRFSNEWSPYITPDKEYFVFQSVRGPILEYDPAETATWSEMMAWHQQPASSEASMWVIRADFVKELRETAQWPETQTPGGDNE